MYKNHPFRLPQPKFHRDLLYVKSLDLKFLYKISLRAQLHNVLRNALLNTFHSVPRNAFRNALHNVILTLKISPYKKPRINRGFHLNKQRDGSAPSPLKAPHLTAHSHGSDPFLTTHTPFRTSSRPGSLSAPPSSAPSVLCLSPAFDGRTTQSGNR